MPSFARGGGGSSDSDLGARLGRSRGSGALVSQLGRMSGLGIRPNWDTPTREWPAQLGHTTGWGMRQRTDAATEPSSAVSCAVISSSEIEGVPSPGCGP